MKLNLPTKPHLIASTKLYSDVTHTRKINKRLKQNRNIFTWEWHQNTFFFLIFTEKNFILVLETNCSMK